MKCRFETEQLETNITLNRMMISAILHSTSKDGLHTKEYKAFCFGRLSTDILNRIPFVNLQDATSI